MNKVFNRDEFINEVYMPLVEQEKYDELSAVNEGLIKNLFGRVKNLFVNDWKKIKGDAGIIKAYKEMDDKMTGFITMKMFNRDDCNRIRQSLVDFACLWYEHKSNQAKKDNSEPSPVESLKFKDSTLKESLETCQKSIRDITKKDSQMATWANALLDGMKVVINQVVLNEIDDAELREKFEKVNAEQEKKNEDINKKMEEFQNKLLNDIQKERKRLISGAKCKAFDDSLLGDKAAQNLTGEFDKISQLKKMDDKITAMKNDSMFGFKTIYSDSDYSSKWFKSAYLMTEAFYDWMKGNGEDDSPKEVEKFKDVPGQSIQAMCIAVNGFIKGCFIPGNDYGDVINLMSRCAIISNGSIGYNLPVADKKNDSDDDKNTFTLIVTSIQSKSNLVEDIHKNKIPLPDDFEKNAETLMNKIVTEATKLKKAADKKNDDMLKQFNDEYEKNK